MTKHERTIDREVANCAVVAKANANARGACAAAEFAKLTKHIPRVTSAQRGLPRNFAEFWGPEETLEKEHRKVRLRTLRFDLEASLLGLDDYCWLPLGSKIAYPSEVELDALGKLVYQVTILVSKVPPPPGWACWKRVDRRFPKVRLCKRVKALVKRIVAATPPRPLAALMRPVGRGGDELAKEFFETLLAIRSGKRDARLVDWEHFTPILLRYQNAELERAGGKPLSILRPLRSAPGGPAIEAYVTYLELDRADLQWTSRCGRDISVVKRWVQSLENAELILAFKPFCAGTVNEGRD